ncbi:KRAB [Lepeophtheirus salmonis]|uniref:KRAB n=1 Tax=Lepeophtheirus salmonis TaxID=72036 RepID=A0A7R8CE55_LEPSM|nr:KRAB [Lepeophtheirus salmonis]CAF2792738.1 KRAB [Lepeophtheirus salmonis]
MENNYSNWSHYGRNPGLNMGEWNQGFLGNYDSSNYQNYYNHHQYPQQNPFQPAYYNDYYYNQAQGNRSASNVSSQSINNSYENNSLGFREEASIPLVSNGSLQSTTNSYEQNSPEASIPSQSQDALNHEQLPVLENVEHFVNNIEHQPVFYPYYQQNYNMQPMHFAPPSGSSAYNNESMNVVHPIHDQVHSIDHQPFPEVSQPTAHVQPAAHPSPAVPPQKNFTAIKNRKPSLKMKRERKKRSSPHDPIPHLIVDPIYSDILRPCMSLILSSAAIPSIPPKHIFEAHRLDIHEDGMFKCQIHDCGRSFNRKALLHKHEDTFHSEESSKRIFCSVCLIPLPHPLKSEETVKRHAFLHSSLA